MPLPLRDVTLNDVKDQILGAFSAWVEQRLPGTPITYRNLNFDPDAEFADSDANDRPIWMRAVVQHTPGASDVNGLGNRYYRRVGVVIVQVFGRKGTGEVEVNNAAEIVLKFFETANLPGLWFRSPGPAEAGDDGAWYQVNVSSAMAYDILRTQ